MALLSLLVVGAACGGAAAAGNATPDAAPAPSELVSPRPISLSGAQTYAFEAGAVHAEHAQVPPDFELTADRLALDFAWKNTTRSTADDGDPLYQHTTEEGRQTPRFEDATRVRLEPFGGRPEILAYANGTSPSIELEADGEQTVTARTPTYLTGVGHSPDTQQTNGSRYVGFWYAPDPQWVAVQRSDRAHLAGNFSLFVNNVTVVVEDVGGGETLWRNWTGHTREETAPGVVEAERHLLELTVTRGALALAGDAMLDAYARSFTLDAVGVVSTPRATGTLSTHGDAYRFEADPLHLEGRGTLKVTRANASALGPTAPPGAQGLGLEVAGSSSFDVEGGQPIPSPHAAGGGPAWWPIAGALGVAGLAGAAAWLARSGHVGPLLAEWRSRRYAKWMTQGRTLLDGGDYASAAECYERAVRARPDKGLAHHHLAMALVETGDPEQALAVVDEARADEVRVDELDLLEVEVAAARRLGRMDRCRRALEQLADGSEFMAKTLARDLSLDEHDIGPELADRLDRADDEGDLAGYA